VYHSEEFFGTINKIQNDVFNEVNVLGIVVKSEEEASDLTNLMLMKHYKDKNFGK